MTICYYSCRENILAICSYWKHNLDNISTIVIEKKETIAAIFIQKTDFATDAITKKKYLCN